MTNDVRLIRTVILDQVAPGRLKYLAIILGVNRKDEMWSNAFAEREAQFRFEMKGDRYRQYGRRKARTW